MRPVIQAKRDAIADGHQVFGLPLPDRERPGRASHLGALSNFSAARASGNELEFDITTSGPGDQFCVRNVGNLVPPYGSNSNSVDAAVEHAVKVLGVGSIVVCGHSHCGATSAALESSVRSSTALPDIIDPVTGVRLSQADKLAVTNVAVRLENLRSFECVRPEAGLEHYGRLFSQATVCL